MENPFETLAKDINIIKSMVLELQKTKVQTGSNFPEIMSVEEAAEFLRSSKSKLYQQTSKGEIPHFKQGSRVLFSRADLLKWLEQFKQIDIQTANASCDSFLASNRK